MFQKFWKMLRQQTDKVSVWLTKHSHVMISEAGKSIDTLFWFDCDLCGIFIFGFIDACRSQEG